MADINKPSAAWFVKLIFNNGEIPPIHRHVKMDHFRTPMGEGRSLYRIEPVSPSDRQKKVAAIHDKIKKGDLLEIVVIRKHGDNALPAGLSGAQSESCPRPGMGMAQENIILAGFDESGLVPMIGDDPIVPRKLLGDLSADSVGCGNSRPVGLDEMDCCHLCFCATTNCIWQWANGRLDNRSFTNRPSLLGKNFQWLNFTRSRKGFSS